MNMPDSGHGVRSFMPAKHGRPTAKLPSGRSRRRMKQRLNKDYGQYGQRSQAETANSMLKRNMGDALRAKTPKGRQAEQLMRVLTHNIALLCDYIED